MNTSEPQLTRDLTVSLPLSSAAALTVVSLFRSFTRRAMFMSGLSESTQTHVHLRNVDAATLQIIITYAYTGNLAISDSTVEPLYETACFLQVSAVKDKEKEQPVLFLCAKELRCRSKFVSIRH